MKIKEPDRMKFGDGRWKMGDGINEDREWVKEGW
jgi:hypothetical protein